MKVNSATYGEVNNGHALRAASADHDFARSISGRFDLPSAPPHGVAWSPATSGFPTQGRYVVGRTFLDPKASRGNMVRAHALFVQLDEIQNFGSLKRLFDRLASSLEEVPEPLSFDLEDSEEDIATSDLTALAPLLVSRSGKPVVLLGGECMEQTIAALWHNLWPSMRRTFSFRMSFAPDDIVESPIPAVICTPSSLAVRWNGFPIMGQSNAPTSLAAQALTGEGDTRPLHDFASNLGTDDIDLSTFPRLVKAYELMDAEPSFNALVAGMRLMAFLSPQAEAGQTLKTNKVDQLARMIIHATPEQIMSLRNLTLTGYASLRPIWEAITAWMGAGTMNERTPDELIPIIAASHAPNEAIVEWQSAIVRGGLLFASQLTKDFARTFWTWLTLRPDLSQAVLEMTPSSPSIESELLASIPEAVKTNSAFIRTEFVARNWLTLHAATLARSMKPADALRAQLQVDRQLSFADGVKEALSRAKPVERVDIAREHDDPRLDIIAGTEIVANHRLLQRMDMAEPSTQRLWASAINLDLSSWRAPHAPQASRDVVLTSLLDGTATFEPLVDALARTPLADLNDFCRKAELWRRVDFPKEFLVATADGWLERAAAGNANSLDPQLEQTVLKPKHLDVHLTGDLGSALNIIASLKEIPEERAILWFEVPPASTSKLTHAQTEVLGHIILTRRWKRLLDRVIDRMRTQPELRATLRICASMVPPISRWLMGLTTVGSTEKWEGLADLAADLYPSGPEHLDLWERAGGRNSDLPQGKNGAEKWRLMLRQVRAGSSPRISKLLDEMMKDFRNNPSLQLIAHDPEFNPTSYSNWRQS